MSSVADPDEPRPGLGGEPAHHAAYLRHYRETVIGAVQRLDATQQRCSVLPSGWTPIELLSHVLHMEQRWFVWGFLGEDVAEPWGDWDVADPRQAPGEASRWQVPGSVTAGVLAARLRAVGERTEEVLSGHALDERASTRGRFAGTLEAPPDLRWICFHVLQEYARHAGHLDAVVELLGAGRQP